MKAERHLKLVAEPLWKRALRNRKHWDNYQVAATAFELARKLEVDRKLDEEKRLQASRDREAAKQRQIRAEHRTRRSASATIEPLPLPAAGNCERCGKPMIFKSGIARAVHAGTACTRNGITLIPFSSRVTPQRCKTSKCPKPAASEIGLCALCASRARRAVVSTPEEPQDASPEKNPASGGSVDGS